MNLLDQLTARVLAPTIERRVQLALSEYEADAALFHPMNAQAPARPWHEVRDTLDDAAEAMEDNPLAARIIALKSDFIIGAGPDEPTDPWLRQFWTHPLNHIASRLHSWADELSGMGELFIVLSRNAADGMSYVREIPAMHIDAIDTDPEDSEHELRYHQLTADLDGRWWPSASDAAEGEHQVMLHFAVNRRPGMVRGRSDLAQVLPWLEHYDLWLKDRVRINRYKGAYLWHVTVTGAKDNALRTKRQQYSSPPASGSIIVTDESETWAAVQPSINADDVAADGHALRTMIAAGAGIPLHWLAEPGSTNRATASSMDIPTLRGLSRRQSVLAGVINTVAATAAQRAGRPVPPRVELPTIEPSDDAIEGQELPHENDSSS